MNTKPSAGPLTAVSGIIFLLLGLALAGGGAYLAALGGSLYYVIAGIGIAVTGILLILARRAALWLYAIVLAGTVIWSIAEVKFSWWDLVPRIAVWLVLGIYLLLPFVNRRLGRTGETGGRAPLLVAAALGVVTLAIGLFTDYDDHPGEVPEANMAATQADDVPGVAAGDWTQYGRSGYGDRFSPAKQITPANVAKLQEAWTFHTGDFKGPTDPGEIANEVTPLKANGMLYICTPHNIVIALDPDTGKEIWRHDPKINRDAKTYQHMICRGVSYYDATAYAKTGPDSIAGAASAAAPASAGSVAAAPEAAVPAIAAECPRRIYAPTADATVVAINADNGKACGSFGDHGKIDLTQGMSMTERGFLNPTSPPVVTRNILIVYASVTDNDSTHEPSGVIRGYDINTGKLVWNWDASNPDRTEPLKPGEYYVHNSPNSWTVSSVDEKLGLVYVPMGNETPDIFGGNRNPEGAKYSTAIVALDVATGKLRWHFQTVHHDLWDMDIGGQPSLVDIDTANGKVPALVASTKRGDIYVLNRKDGTPVVPITEKPVPQGAVEGDFTSPTQPFSDLSFKPEPLNEAKMWGTDPFSQLVCRISFKKLRYEGMFTPPSLQGSLVYPGNYGVFDWGGITVDPVHQVLIGNPNYVAFVSKLYKRDTIEVKGGSGTEQGLQPMTGTPYAVDLHPLLSPLGIPCQSPPWGYVAAVDLKTMKKVWMHKNGTVLDSAPLPIPLPLGVPSLGGAITTGGGVAFMSATLDYYLRAYDVRDGKVLWKARLPAGGQANPMSYVSDKTGRQYVVIMAGGHGSLGTKMGDSLIAYALPEGAAPAASAPAK
ncbi:glucose/quinate/shikimate family membrane-bound PQQ-dependent dehydrogenase [Frateuria defendens]|uniref:glucose/quinate/shikimate family membrane-bound PQQ-dependent dehydrogenase n=1 Tax=Frateuria defendens TaxID=2219559 RepID=UPI00066FB55A|nr:glucose/quinate/shikimate family membrane-bound PQQ-dependent dehydrogenase [Frateuria defendens]